jgi:hypothetical protein
MSTPLRRRPTRPRPCVPATTHRWKCRVVVTGCGVARRRQCDVAGAQVPVDDAPGAHARHGLLHRRAQRCALLRAQAPPSRKQRLPWRLQPLGDQQRPAPRARLAHNSGDQALLRHRPPHARRRRVLLFSVSTSPATPHDRTIRRDVTKSDDTFDLWKVWWLLPRSPTGRYWWTPPGLSSAGSATLSSSSTVRASPHARRSQRLRAE